MTTVKEDYSKLVKNFLNKKISVEEFEKSYIDLHLNEKREHSDELFEILDWLFAEVDGFSNDPDYLPDFYVSEEQLRESAAKVLKEIRALK